MKLSQEEFLKYATPRLNFIYQADFDNEPLEKVAFAATARAIGSMARTAGRASWQGAKWTGQKIWDGTKWVYNQGKTALDKGAKKLQTAEYERIRSAVNAGKMSHREAKAAYKRVGDVKHYRRGILATGAIGTGAVGAGIYAMSGDSNNQPSNPYSQPNYYSQSNPYSHPNYYSQPNSYYGYNQFNR